jgi:hypothetical protein
MGLLIKLQNGDTQLKSLKFGNDRPGGGDSGQPFIQSPIGDQNQPSALDTDFLLRGGINAPRNAVTDVIRLSKYFINLKSPKGLLFTAKQNILSLTAPETEASGKVNGGIYTPLSTLAQAGVGFLGGHLNKQGLDPTGIISALSIKDYGPVVYQKNQDDKNRLVGLLKSTTNISSSLNPDILSYPGGPGSTLGIGNTNIKFSTDANGTPIKTSLNPSNNTILPKFDASQTSGFSTWNREILDLILTPNLDANVLEDFREKLTPTTNQTNTFLTSTKTYTGGFEKRFGLDGGTDLSAGSRKRNRSNYEKGSITPNKSFSTSLDKINAYPIYKSENAQGTRYGTYDDLKDMIQFSIAILNNDSQTKTTPPLTYKKYMHFRSFIDSFSDSYNADWKSLNYMGRGEKLYKYNGFDRKISMAFTVVAQSKNELSIMYDKLNFLASSLAPEYLDSLTSGYMAGNIAYITLGDYINDQPGVITSLSYDVPEESPWEINRLGDKTDNEGIRQLPHMIKIQLSFIPIQKFRPSKQSWADDFTEKGEGKPESTILFNPGNQRFIDKDNPYNFTNFSNKQNNEEKIAIQNNVQQNTIVDS